ncbi:hypothetical protein CR513_43867, partial [Mucuna pruriens]
MGWEVTQIGTVGSLSRLADSLVHASNWFIVLQAPSRVIGASAIGTTLTLSRLPVNPIHALGQFIAPSTKNKISLCRLPVNLIHASGGDFASVLRARSSLANVIMVRKSSGKWRMCMNYTNLNKACSKDLFSLPNIDDLVDRASGCGYRVMSFELKNVEVTYQWLMD